MWCLSFHTIYRRSLSMLLLFVILYAHFLWILLVYGYFIELTSLKWCALLQNGNMSKQKLNNFAHTCDASVGNLLNVAYFLRRLWGYRSISAYKAFRLPTGITEPCEQWQSRLPGLVSREKHKSLQQKQCQKKNRASINIWFKKTDKAVYGNHWQQY